MRKTFLTSTLVLSIILSGCQFSINLPQSQEQTKQVWEVHGNQYSTSITYDTPEGQETNEFILTLEDGIVTSIDVGIATEVKASRKYQQDFSDELTTQIVGKKLSDLSPFDRITGATLTTDAFNKVLKELQNQLSS